MPRYQIKDWPRFQHYKDRNPPWIRLHKSLLDNYEFHCLQDASKALAPCLWLLASENKEPGSGVIDASDEKIAFRLHTPLDKLRKCINELIDRGFLEYLGDTSETLSGCKHNDTPEAEAEAEAESGEATIIPPNAFVLPLWVPQQDWQDWLEVRKRKKAPNTKRALNLALSTLEKLQLAGNDPSLVLQKSIMSGYPGLYPVNQPSGGNYGQPKPTKLDFIAAGIAEARAKREQREQTQA